MLWSAAAIFSFSQGSCIFDDLAGEVVHARLLREWEGIPVPSVAGLLEVDIDADFNDNGIVDVGDAAKINYYYLGLIDEL